MTTTTEKEQKAREREAKRLNPDKERFEYVGTYETDADWAKADCIQLGECPADLPDYIMDNIDWAAVAERLLCQDYTSVAGKYLTHYYRAL